MTEMKPAKPRKKNLEAAGSMTSLGFRRILRYWRRWCARHRPARVRKAQRREA